MNLESRVSLLESKARLDKTPNVKIHSLGERAIAEILAASIGENVGDFLANDGALIERVAGSNGSNREPLPNAPPLAQKGGWRQ